MSKVPNALNTDFWRFHSSLQKESGFLHYRQSPRITFPFAGLWMNFWMAKATCAWCFPLLSLVLYSCGSAEEGATRVPPVLFSCKPRPVTDGNCWAIFHENSSFEHRGSELNDGRLTMVDSDEECCRLCQKTPGCIAWGRFHKNNEYNPLRTCWLKSSIVEATENDLMNVGVINLPEGSVPCNPLMRVGFRNVAPYNFPDLLLVNDAETCCRLCRDAAELCTGWTWNKVAKHCSLYGIELKPSNEYTCRDCYSGRRTPNRAESMNRTISKEHSLAQNWKDDLMNIPSCNASRFNRLSYSGSDMIKIVSEGSFSTDTSNECCGLCERIRDCRSWSWTKDHRCALNAIIVRPITDDHSSVGGVAEIKVCDPEECELFEDVDIDATELSDTQFAAPDGDSLMVPNHKACCSRCQEFPECNSWVFKQGSSPDEYSPCFLKSVSFSVTLFKAREPNTFSGIVAGRIPDNVRTDFYQLLEELLQGDSNGRGSILSPPVIGGVVAGISVFLFIIFSVRYCINQRRKARILKGVSVNTDGSDSHVAKEPERGLSLTKYPERHVTSVPSGPHTKIDKIVCDPLVPSTPERSAPEPSIPERSAQEIEVMKKFVEDSIDDSLGFKRHSTSQRSEESTWLQYKQRLISLECGLALGGKYVIDTGHHAGEESIVVNATHRVGHGEPLVAIKFFRYKSVYDAEVNFFYDNRESPYVPQVFDVFAADEVEAWGLPALCCMMMERGSTTLSEMLSFPSRKLDDMDQRNFLYKICKAVADLHDRSIVHRNIKPDNIVMFNKTLTWKLLDFGSWGKKNTIDEIKFSLVNAPPELVEARALGKPLRVSPSADMWALGLIFWEVLTGDALFGHNYTDRQVLSMLLGLEDLPCEQRRHQIPTEITRRLVMKLLQRNPLERLTIDEVLRNGYFLCSPDTFQIHERNKQVTSILSNIEGAIHSVENRIQKVEEIALENLKEAMGNVLIACISLYEIEDKEFARLVEHDSRLAEMYKNKFLRIHKAYLEPNFNVFKRKNEEPAMLLRMKKNHLIKVTLMYGRGGSVALDLPISEMLSARITPISAENDAQELKLFMISDRGHVMDAVGVWNTTHHEDASFWQTGSVSVQVCLRVRLKATNEVLEIQKAIDIRMHSEKERFRTIKQFHRTKAFYENIPPSAKIYIHGAVAIASLAMKGVL